MKKILTMILSLTLMLGLCACSATGSNGTQNTEFVIPSEPSTSATIPDIIDSNFLAGFGEADITPTESVPLLGYGTSTDRWSDGILSNLYAHCLAVRDEEGNTALMISVDGAAAPGDHAALMIQSRTGIPVSNIIISACHQHSTPEYSSSVCAAAARYYTLMTNGIVDSAVRAISDLAPAEMYATSTETKNLNFVRNYILSDGTFLGDNYGTIGPGVTIVGHESDADATLQLLKFVRGGDKKDIIVANFQGHPHLGGNMTRSKVHADIVGVFRDELTAKLDCNVMYFSGAGGNINFTSRIPKEIRYSTIYSHGAKLADYAYKAEGTYTKLNTGKVQGLRAIKTYNTDKSQEHLYARAVEFMKIWNTQGQSAAQAALKDFPEFHSVYHGKYVVIKHNLAATRNLNIYAISFGDVGFTGVPCEMFDENGEQIKSNSPFKMTIVSTMANGADGYIPSQRGYDNGGYSTDITRYAPGTGELVANDLVSLLTQMKNTQ